MPREKKRPPTTPRTSQAQIDDIEETLIRIEASGARQHREIRRTLEDYTNQRFNRIEDTLEKTSATLARMATEQERQWKMIGAAIEDLTQSAAKTEATVAQVVREWQGYLKRQPRQ
jgi:predicted metal-dependent hydrolase